MPVTEETSTIEALEQASTSRVGFWLPMLAQALARHVAKRITYANREQARSAINRLYKVTRKHGYRDKVRVCRRSNVVYIIPKPAAA